MEPLTLISFDRILDMKFPSILRRNRKRLDLTQQEIADIWGIASVNVSDWETGKGMPEASRLPALAKRLGISVSDLLGEKSNVTAGPELRGSVPLISWVRAGTFCESPDNFHPGDAEDWFDCPVPHSENTYCLKVSGDSMSKRELQDAYYSGALGGGDSVKGSIYHNNIAYSEVIPETIMEAILIHTCALRPPEDRLIKRHKKTT